MDGLFYGYVYKYLCKYLQSNKLISIFAIQNRGVYQLVDFLPWEQEAARSSRATATRQ